MRLKIGLFAVLLLLLVAPVLAQDVDNLAAIMDSTLTAVEEEFPFVPGFSVAVVKDGAVIWSGGYGYADVEAGTPATADTLFPAASISKVVTAYAILGMADEGLIDLDAPVNSYLTRWQVTALGRNDPANVTIRRILSHTAGLSAEGYPGFAADAALPTLEEFLDGAGGDPVRMVISAGRTFMYSGGGYTVLQLLIEELSGMSYEDYMQSAVFEPLGMTNSTFVWTPELGAAAQYDRNGEPFLNVVHVDQAAGGLLTSANDLGAFFGALMQDARSGAIFTAAEGTREEYGYGVYVDQTESGERMIWHDGLGRGMHAIFYLFPDAGEGVVILTNTPPGTAVVNPAMCAYDRWSDVDASEFCEG
ncbi:MAG: beta-lactamase family protein [Anaerolinea sp.]|nr:beta-lactamase family protein [Anaerolinea sp.]